MNGLNDTLNQFARMAQLPPFDMEKDGVLSLQLEEDKQLFIERVESGHIVLSMSIEARDIAMKTYLHILAQCHPQRRAPFQMSIALIRDHTHIALVRIEEERFVISLFEQAIDRLLQLTQAFKG
ncbi:MAG: CesT family type III secretion system chaperone [Alphaproteobacteria bacterium GM7ARS4]|nr:CesT family type III secretion system chaperone [Alphaproteobacteria bacterium GM7ARS4]